MKKLLSLFFLLLFATACAAQPQPTEDVGGIVRATLTALAGQPQATQAATPLVLPPAATPTPQQPAPSASPSAPNGAVAVAYGGMSFAIPAGLASGAQNEIVPQANDPNIPFQMHPAYTKFVLQGYAQQGAVFEPQILVYPAAEFAQMSESAKSIIDNLKSVLAAQRTSPAEHLPFLPMLNASQLLHAQEKFLAFKNGAGIRYLTQFDQAPLPINNSEIIYTFQGLTSDGSYYVAVILPVSLPYLPADNHVPSSAPAGGVPFPSEIAGYPAYLTAIVERLNQANGPIQPALETLDALVQSLLTAGQK